MGLRADRSNARELDSFASENLPTVVPDAKENPRGLRAVDNSQYIGSEFEQRFMAAAQAAGLYIQPMPPRIGFDFLIQDGDAFRPVEAKHVSGNRLRLRNFTLIEIRVAEEITAAGGEYLIVYPLYGAFGRITWATIRGNLLAGRTVELTSPHADRILDV